MNRITIFVFLVKTFFLKPGQPHGVAKGTPTKSEFVVTEMENTYPAAVVVMSPVTQDCGDVLSAFKTDTQDSSSSSSK